MLSSAWLIISYNILRWISAPRDSNPSLPSSLQDASSTSEDAAGWGCTCPPAVLHGSSVRRSVPRRVRGVQAELTITARQLFFFLFLWCCLWMSRLQWACEVLTQLAAGGAALKQSSAEKRGWGGASLINGSMVHHMGCEQKKSMKRIEMLSISEMEDLMKGSVAVSILATRCHQIWHIYIVFVSTDCWQIISKAQSTDFSCWNSEIMKDNLVMGQWTDCFLLLLILTGRHQFQPVSRRKALYLGIWCIFCRQ